MITNDNKTVFNDNVNRVFNIGVTYNNEIVGHLKKKTFQTLITDSINTTNFNSINWNPESIELPLIDNRLQPGSKMTSINSPEVLEGVNLYINSMKASYIIDAWKKDYICPQLNTLYGITIEDIIAYNMEVSVYNKLTKIPTLADQYQLFIDNAQKCEAEEIKAVNDWDKLSALNQRIQLAGKHWTNVPTLVIVGLGNEAMADITAFGITDDRAEMVNKVIKILGRRKETTTYLSAIKGFQKKCKSNDRDTLRFLNSKSSVKNVYFTIIKFKNKTTDNITTIRKKATEAKKDVKAAASTMALAGKTVKEIALELDQDPAKIKRWVSKDVSTFKKDRTKKIIEMFKSGATNAATAKEFNLSTNTIERIKATWKAS